jgi:glycosyltransferase involved in cell wall biosynthesis
VPSKIKLLFIPNSYPSKEFPYQSKFFVDHVSTASEIVSSLYVVSGMFNFSSVSVNKERNVVFVTGRSHKKNSSFISTIFGLIKFIIIIFSINDKVKIDGIIAHGIKWADLICALSAKICKKPYILYIHSAYPSRHKSWYLPLAYFSINLADHVIFTSQSQAMKYKEKFKSIKFFTILGNPVDTKNFNLRHSRRNINRHINIVFAGRPTKEKGFDKLFGVFKYFHLKKNNKVKFKVITNLEMMLPAHKSLIKNKYESFVELINFQDKMTFSKILSDSDYFLCLSKFESFSYVITEAMSCGKPIVSTKCGGPEDYIDKNSGILIKSSKLDDIINSINLMNETYMDYDRNIIRHKIVSKYSYHIFQNKLSKIFNRVFFN